MNGMISKKKTMYEPGVEIMLQASVSPTSGASEEPL